jgi:hypothetical protein
VLFQFLIDSLVDVPIDLPHSEINDANEKQISKEIVEKTNHAFQYPSLDYYHTNNFFFVDHIENYILL